MNPSASPRRPRGRLALAALLCLNVLFAGAGIFAFRPLPTAAQGDLPPDQQAVLEAVRDLVAAPEDLSVQQLPDGSYFADAGGQLQAVLLAATNADGDVITRCVETVEEAAAFLAEAPTLTSAAPVAPDSDAERLLQAASDNPATLAAALAASQTQIQILVADGPGEGFNDPTPAAPVGGNTGTTVGQQRLRAFEYAAAIWGATLQSTVPIVIRAQFNPLTPCSAGGGVLGSAGPQTVHSDFTGSGNFPGAGQANTWYVQALANQRAGRDLDSARADVSATFNSRVGEADCIAGSGWYYGFDGNEGAKIDLITTLLHEFGHGLGFVSLVTVGTGANYESRNDIWNYYVTGSTSGGVASTLWKDMSASQRLASITSNNLVWGGAATNAAAARLYGAAAPRLTVASPGGLGPYTGAAAPFGPPIGDTPIAGALVAATDQDEDGAGASYTALDACTPLTNAAAVAGKVALVTRGPCAPGAQARNLQAAGAIAAVVADNIAVGTPPELVGEDTGVTIPAMSVTRAAGDALRAALGSGAVSVSIAVNRPGAPGIDSLGRIKLYAPSPAQSGSSVSHFDTAAAGPNLLMEPRINADISQSLDLTDELMRDIGWFPDLNYNGLDDRRELALSVSQAARSTFVRPGQPFTLAITVRNRGYTAAGVTLTDAFPAAFTGVTWTAAYSGGAAGPASGSGNISAALTLPAGSSATFTVSATAPATLGATAPNTASIARVGGAELVDATGAADDSSSLGMLVTNATITDVFLPTLRK